MKNSEILELPKIPVQLQATVTLTLEDLQIICAALNVLTWDKNSRDCIVVSSDIQEKASWLSSELYNSDFIVVR